MKTNYQITIGYKAVICINVKEENEEAAKETALNLFKNYKDKMFSGKSPLELQDDNFKVDGILNMDETWNMVHN